MHTASKSLKKAHQDLDVDKIADLMDDIQEQQDVRISTMVSIVFVFFPDCYFA